MTRGPEVKTSAKAREKTTVRCITMKQKALRSLETLSDLVKAESVAQPFSSTFATQVVVEINKLIGGIQETRRRRESLASGRGVHRGLE